VFYQVKEYDYVMDEEIEFVQALKMEGTRKEKVCNSSSLRWSLVSFWSDDATIMS